MKICYFSDTASLYIELAPRASSSSNAVSDNLICELSTDCSWPQSAMPSACRP